MKQNDTQSLLRDPIIVQLSKDCEVCRGPFNACDCMPNSPLIVTRNGVPCADQKAALREFKERCRSRKDVG